MIERYKLKHKTGGWGFIIKANTPEEAIAKTGIKTPADQWDVKPFPAPCNPDAILDEKADALIKGEGSI